MTDRTRRTAALTLLLVVQAVLLLVVVRRNFVVLDEVGHVPAGLSHWETGSFGLYRVNPPLPDMLATLPVLLARPVTDFGSVNPSPGLRIDWEVGRDFARDNAARYFDLVCLARLPGLLCALLGTCLIFHWARELYGEAGGWLGAVLWAFDPTVLAFSAVVTPDIASAVAGVAATYAFRTYLRRGSWGSAVWAGLLLGVAQLTKFTLLVLYVVWPLLWLVWRRTAERPKRGTGRTVRQALVMVLISIYIINAGYTFEGTGRALGDFTFFSATLAGRAHEGSPRGEGNRFRGTPLGELPVPVPAEYLQGIDAQKKDFESRYPSYLAGRWRTRGWYHYYLYALMVKEPLGTLALAAWALALVALRHPASARPAEECFLLLPAGVILAFVSSQDGFNHHMRYVLAIFPFLAIATGKLAYFLRAGRSKASAAVLALVAWSILSTLSIHPHAMSYFNELAGGPRRGHDHLLDSNIDWGQDLLNLRDWLKAHPEARPIGLAYFHFLDPGPFLGVEYHVPPLGPPGTIGPHPEEYGPKPGYYALSVNYLRGITFGAPDGKGGWTWIPEHDSLAYFRRFRPIARAGYSIYIYHITPEQADAERVRMGLPPLGERARADAPLPRSP